jgi:hypothetical protein
MILSVVYWNKFQILFSSVTWNTNFAEVHILMNKNTCMHTCARARLSVDFDGRILIHEYSLVMWGVAGPVTACDAHSNIVHGY